VARDPVLELRYALAEVDTDPVPGSVRERVLAASTRRRPPGDSVEAGEWRAGTEAFSRAANRLRLLLSGLEAQEWRQPTIRDLDVQGLVGHLIGVEEDFSLALQGFDWPSTADHVSSTQDRAVAQAGRDPAHTLGDWSAAVNRTLEQVQAVADAARQVSFHGVTLDLDSLLVVRAFELWTHDEDIRRALTRATADPEPDVLSRMTALAVPMLPTGIGSVGQRTDKTARLVLIGAGGGAWDVALDGTSSRPTPGSQHDVHITVDAAAFCRVVANRASLETSKATVQGDRGIARAVFAGAATLAFD
jgi:uncharacterized protein (TIGR03083 family)